MVDPRIAERQKDLMCTVPVLDTRTEESIAGGEDVSPSPRAPQTWRALVETLGQGTVVARTATRLGRELAKIAVGRSALAPAQGDCRFADPAWTTNPLFRRIQQTYLASTGALGDIVEERARTSEDPVCDHGRDVSESE